MIIKKIRSVYDGNSLDVIKLKVKKFLYKEKNINFPKTINYNEIPIVINNRNRLIYLKELINWLEKKNYRNIIIIDNQSTYLPLLKYYNETRYKVIRLNKNLGYLSLWKSDLFHLFKNNFYVYTDPDILPTDECPSDVINYFYQNLIKFNEIDKVGFGLKIDDINSSNKNFIINNEKKFWVNKYKHTNFFAAPIDTTFALYKPLKYGGYWLKSLRSNYPYLAKHLPWYENNINNEIKFYRQNINYKSSFYDNQRGNSYEL